jgi:cold shock CspA family protein
MRVNKKERRSGVVKFFTDFRGFGFVAGGDQEYFVHSSSITGANHLLVGDKVEFTVKTTPKGPAAIDVKVTSRDTKAEDEIEQQKWIFMKKNPFTPQDPVVDPERFAGRRAHVGNAIDAIYNAKNILITGPRGIGKSSLAYQLMYLAGGENRLAERLDIDLGGQSFNRAIGDHRCTQGNTLASISSALIATLYSNMGKSFIESSKQVSSEVNLKYFKIGESVDYDKVSSGDLAGMFAMDVAQLFKDSGHQYLGVTLLINEIDTLDNSLDLASFLKAVLERFRLQYHLDISFILSGVTGTVTNLVVQHPSAGRLFENLAIGPMTTVELGQIMDLSLEGSGVAITDGAKSQICNLANNFPQPVKLLGYHAFRLDSDAHICEQDVEASKRFVVENVKNQEFQERFGSLLHGGMRSVARAFAISMYETIGLSYLKKHCKNFFDAAIKDAVSELIDHDIVEEVERNVWRFKDPLFRIYFRLALGIDEGLAARERGLSPGGKRGGPRNQERRAPHRRTRRRRER